jgi:hypothetical protein
LPVSYNLAWAFETVFTSLRFRRGVYCVLEGHEMWHRLLRLPTFSVIFGAPMVCLLAGEFQAAPAQDGGTDGHVLALWLFDETAYPNVTLTDAGPLHADLRIETGRERPLPASMIAGRRGLVPGKFGNALALPIEDRIGVVWATSRFPLYDASGHPERGDEAPESLNLGYLDWTIECWFQAIGRQQGHAVLWEVRNRAIEYAPAGRFPPSVNSLHIDDGRQGFFLVCHPVAGEFLRIPSDPAKLNDGRWHHLAFTFTRAERQIRHYLDGRLQPLPPKGGWLPMMGQIASLRIGRDINGDNELAGALDEFRVSDVVRYPNDFTPPGTFASRHRRVSSAKPGPTGPPPLFGPPAAAKTQPLPLGNRKHVFIDGEILDRREGVTFTVHPPQRREATDFVCDRAWESTPRFGCGVPDICSIVDDGGRLLLYYTNGGMWGGRKHAVCVAESSDGLHWTKPDLALHAWDGSLKTNIVLRQASQGTVFLDDNPATPRNERFRYVAWCMERGFYVFSSPDGLHWRRNETLALPFDPDGSTEAFWDDQAGHYRAFFRTLALTDGVWGRGIVQARVPSLVEPWPFKPAAKPQWHVFTLPKPTPQEFPPIDCGGQVYRFKGAKYAHAPDVYLAFPWRYVGKDNIRPGSFLMVSRNGDNWTRYERPYYFPSGWQFNRRKVLEGLSEQGLVRRGDELWQYMTVRFTEHGGALYGGKEHDGSGYDRLVRLTQRLDGFVSLDVAKSGAWAETRPLVFGGSQLEINANVPGELRASLLDADGKPLPGLDAAACLPIRGDSVRHIVRWKDSPDLKRHAGNVVRLRLEGRDAQVYAIQFK